MAVYDNDIIQRQAALDAILANAGQNRVASNDQAWQTVVAPALTGPSSRRAQQTRDMWSQRNTTVGNANQAMVGGYGSALNADRVQQEQEWLRKYLESQAGSPGGSSGGGGGGSSPSAAATVTSVPTDDPWAWLDDYVQSNAPSAPPSLKPSKPVATSNPGGGRGGKPATVGKPKPASLPKMRYS